MNLDPTEQLPQEFDSLDQALSENLTVNLKMPGLGKGLAEGVTEYVLCTGPFTNSLNSTYPYHRSLMHQFSSGYHLLATPNQGIQLHSSIAAPSE
jgi:hypothetical protein